MSLRTSMALVLSDPKSVVFNLLCVVDKIVVNQLCLFSFSFFLSFFFLFNDTMIAALCFKSERFNESIAKSFHDSGPSIYIFLDDLQSQTGIYLNNDRRWKIAQEKKLSLLVLPLEYRNHRETLIVTEASTSFQSPLPVRDFQSLSTSSVLTTMFRSVNANCLNELWSL